MKCRHLEIFLLLVDFILLVKFSHTETLQEGGRTVVQPPVVTALHRPGRVHWARTYFGTSRKTQRQGFLY